MTRIEFKLAMPNKGSWDGKWSGEDRNYTIVKDLDDARVLQLDGRSWPYFWPDGWNALISARMVHEATILEPSDGFHGYGWMVESILRHGKIYADHERPEVTP